MSKQVIFENDKYVAWYHIGPKIVHHQILEFPNDGSLRKVLDAGATVLEKNGGTKWLSDDRAVTGVPPEDLAWSAQVWTPRMIALGWSHWAIVKPVKAMGQVTLKRLAEEFKQLGVAVEFFTAPDAALRWLQSVWPGRDAPQVPDTALR